jgi:hypothetical protein
MKKPRNPACSYALLSLLALTFLAMIGVSETLAGPIKLGIYVFENLEGQHTQSSTFGTRLGADLLPVCEKIVVEDSVPLESNETVRILDEMTKNRKVIVTTLRAVAKDGVVEFPTIAFADDSIKFTDLTWKVDDNKVLEVAKTSGVTKCLMGTCEGIVTRPSADSASGRRGLVAVTASVNVRLLTVPDGEAEWMNTYRQVVSHTDARLAFEQAIEMVSAQVAKDLRKFLGERQDTGQEKKE